MELKVGEKVVCIKMFETNSYNNGLKTGIYPGRIYTIRGFNIHKHLLLKEVSFKISDIREDGFDPSRLDFFVPLDLLLKEE